MNNLSSFLLKVAFICCISFYSHAGLICHDTYNPNYVSCYNEQTGQQDTYLKSDVQAYMQQQQKVKDSLEQMNKELYQQQILTEYQLRQQQMKLQQELQRYKNSYE